MSAETPRQVDSFRFVSQIVRKLMRGWYPKETVRDIPWAPLQKPLDQCRVALVSSAGLAIEGDQPFDQQGERDRPWWGDPSFRRIPSTTRKVRSYHMHINTSFAEEDINSVLPLERLQELAAAGKIGSVADTHYSTMGYVLEPADLLAKTAPEIIAGMQNEEVDLAVLIPV